MGTQGTVELDGVDIRTLGLDRLRRVLAIVPQVKDTYLHSQALAAMLGRADVVEALGYKGLENYHVIWCDEGSDVIPVCVPPGPRDVQWQCACEPGSVRRIRRRPGLVGTRQVRSTHRYIYIEICICICLHKQGSLQLPSCGFVMKCLG